MIQINNKRSLVKVYLVIFTILCLSISALSQTNIATKKAYADTIDDATQISLNKEYKGMITETTNKFSYKFNLSKPSRVTFVGKSDIRYYATYLYNSEYSEIDQGGYESSSVTGLSSYNYFLDLDAGTYFYVISSGSYLAYTGNFSFQINNYVFVNSLSLSPASKAVPQGTKIQFKTVIKPDNANNKELEYSSSNYSCVDIDEDTGFAEATTYSYSSYPCSAVITVNSKDGSGKSASVKIDVRDYLCSDFSKYGVYPNCKTLSQINEEKRQAEIKAKQEAERIRISKLVSSVNLYTISAQAVGQCTQLHTLVMPNTAVNKHLLYTTSNSSIASVSSSGKVCSKKVGNVNIYARSADGTNKQSMISFLVKPKVLSITSFKIAKKKITVKFKKQKGIYKVEKFELLYRVKGAKKWKTLTLKGSASSKIIKKLKTGKKYQFKLRSYVSVNGIKVFSPFSKVKTSKAIK